MYTRIQWEGLCRIKTAFGGSNIEYKNVCHENDSRDMNHIKVNIDLS